MIFGRNRIEEDLEKIRRANLPDKKINEDKYFDELKLEKGDLLAMTLAVMSIIIPYILAFVGIMLGVVFLLRYLF